MRKLLLLLFLVIGTMTAGAYDFMVDGIYYNKSSDSTVYVTNYEYGSGHIIIPKTVSYSGINYSVTKIGNKVFYIDSVLSVTIPNSVTTIGDYNFYYCYRLKSVNIPNSVRTIGTYCFVNLNNSNPLILPDSITSIGHNSFENTSVTANDGTYTLLSLWEIKSEYLPIPRPEIQTVNTTQTSATVVIRNYDSNYVYCYKDSILTYHDDDHIFLYIPDLEPYTYYQFDRIYVKKSINDNTVVYAVPNDKSSFTTASLGMQITTKKVTATSLSFDCEYIPWDAKAKIKNRLVSFIYNNRYSDLTSIDTTGLDPGMGYAVYYKIELQSGRTYNYNGYLYTDTIKFISQPKVISDGNVIVATTSNIDDAETNVGFEWRRTDWSDDFASNTGKAYLYDGQMEGYIRNLNTNYLWKFRPYYESNSGMRYYGEWVGIDPTNTSYFEPTVHTYASVNVNGNTAQVKGYAQRGTDDVTSQGFMYWKNNSTKNAKGTVSYAPSVPTDAQTVTVRTSSSPIMEAALTGLDYNSDYSYVAFVTTSEGTFYGEEQTFKTAGEPTGIVEVTTNTDGHKYPSGIYDLNGRKLQKMQRGVNIVRFDDGTTKKVLVK